MIKGRELHAKEIAEFQSAEQFVEFKKEIGTLVDSGVLVKEGLADDVKSFFFFTRYLEPATGKVWLLAHPDQAFRGYFKEESTSGDETSA